MKKYTYSGKNQQGTLKWQLAGYLAFIGMSPVFLLTLISIFLVPLSPYPETSWNNIRFSLLCWSVLLFFLGFTGCSFFINYFPSIWTDDDAIYISYFIIFRIKIPWNRIIDIVSVKSLPKMVLVRARRITPWHTHYSIYYLRSLKPGFLINESIDNFDELIQVIRKNVNNKQ